MNKILEDWYESELKSEEKRRWELEEKVAELEVELEELLSAISAKSALSALPKQQENEGEWLVKIFVYEVRDYTAITALRDTLPLGMGF